METGSFNANEAAEKAGEKSQEAFKNMFDVLQVYAPSESFLNAPDVAPKSATILEYTVEQDESMEAAIFALVTLLGDYSRLRQEVKSLWADYEANRLDLAAAAVATNMAFELARSMEEEIAPIIRKHDGEAGELATTYFMGLCNLYRIDPGDKQPGDAYNLQAYDLAELCLATTNTLLTGRGGAEEDCHMQ
ncbi:hypothetical protein E5D57_013551 [Metarhizium anisopliae]|nr:hypothetical protein E5D57_013551 [Metarhizium anisopliae]